MALGDGHQQSREKPDASRTKTCWMNCGSFETTPAVRWFCKEFTWPASKRANSLAMRSCYAVDHLENIDELPQKMHVLPNEPRTTSMLSCSLSPYSTTTWKGPKTSRVATSKALGSSSASIGIRIACARCEHKITAQFSMAAGAYCCLPRQLERTKTRNHLQLVQ